MHAHQPPPGLTNDVFKREGEIITVTDSAFDTGDMNNYHKAFGFAPSAKRTPAERTIRRGMAPTSRDVLWGRGFTRAKG